MNHVTRYLFFIFLLLSIVSRVQTAMPDTFFTVDATYRKEVKNYPFIKPAKAELPSTITLKKDVVYAEFGDRKLHLDLFQPQNKRTNKLPAVILVHGGGWKSGNKNMQAPLSIYLAERGYVCATVEYRLSTEAQYPAAIYDLKTATRWLRKNAEIYTIDTQKIAILGCSSGGQLAALLGATNGTNMFCNELYPGYSADVQAVVDIDGILAFVHPESGEGVDKPGQPSAATQWFGFSREEKPELWNEASALTHAGKTFPPILFINSQYPRFHAGRDDLISRLDSLKIYSEVHQIENSPHTFWLFDPWFEPTANWCIQFLNKQFRP
jgi:acetyl esterase/lipase